MSEKVVSETRVIPAAPEVIFELLADPSKHSVFDGSGTVRASRPDAPTRLTLGAQFGMDMKMGVPYRMTNTVVEFEENRRIGWRHVGGHVWRYELEPVEGGTKVTESFDMTTAKSPLMLRLMRAPQRNRESIRATLERLATVVADPGRSGS
ncbi:MAG: SRPBCC family protein [Acidimicrobiales bacterium]